MLHLVCLKLAEITGQIEADTEEKSLFKQIVICLLLAFYITLIPFFLPITEARVLHCIKICYYY